MEVLIGIALLAILIGGIGWAMQNGQESTDAGLDRQRAAYLTERALEGVRSIRDENFSVLKVAATGSGSIGVTLSANTGKWTLQGNSTTTDGYVTSVALSLVGGTRVRVTATTNWKFGIKRAGKVVLTTELVDWNTQLSFGNWAGSLLVSGSWTTGGPVGAILDSHRTLFAGIEKAMAAGTLDFKDVEVIGDYAYVTNNDTPGMYIFRVNQLPITRIDSTFTLPNDAVGGAMAVDGEGSLYVIAHATSDPTAQSSVLKCAGDPGTTPPSFTCDSIYDFDGIRAHGLSIDVQTSRDGRKMLYIGSTFSALLAHVPANRSYANASVPPRPQDLMSYLVPPVEAAFTSSAGPSISSAAISSSSSPCGVTGDACAVNGDCCGAGRYCNAGFCALQCVFTCANQGNTQCALSGWGCAAQAPDPLTGVCWVCTAASASAASLGGGSAGSSLSATTSAGSAGSIASVASSAGSAASVASSVTSGASSFAFIPSADDPPEFWAVDISNAPSPGSTVGTLQFEGSINGLSVNNSGALLATDNDAIEYAAVNLSDLNSVQYYPGVGRDFTDNPDGLAISFVGSGAFLGRQQVTGAPEFNALKLNDWNLTVPTALTNFEVDGDVTSIDRDPIGCYAFITTSKASQEFEIIDPRGAAPSLHKAFSIPGPTRHVRYVPTMDRAFIINPTTLYMIQPGAGTDANCP